MEGGQAGASSYFCCVFYPGYQIYRRRDPFASSLWKLLDKHYDRFQQSYAERYQSRYGYWRPAIEQAVQRFLKCGDLREGFARVRCGGCGHEIFVAFSCKSRCICPSCHQKRILELSAHIAENVCMPVAHRQFVFTMPKRLRIFFRYDRQLLNELPKLAWTIVRDVYRSILERDDLSPGMISTIQTFGELAHFHPHLHSIVTDVAFTPDGSIVPLPNIPVKPFLELWEHKLFALLLRRKKITRAIVRSMRSWKHSGFSLDTSVRIKASDTAALERLVQYITRCPFSLERIIKLTDTGQVIYKADHIKGGAAEWPHHISYNIDKDFIIPEGTETVIAVAAKGSIYHWVNFNRWQTSGEKRFVAYFESLYNGIKQNKYKIKNGKESRNDRVRCSLHDGRQHVVSEEELAEKELEAKEADPENPVKPAFYDYYFRAYYGKALITEWAALTGSEHAIDLILLMGDYDWSEKKASNPAAESKHKKLQWLYYSHGQYMNAYYLLRKDDKRYSYQVANLLKLVEARTLRPRNEMGVVPDPESYTAQEWKAAFKANPRAARPWGKNGLKNIGGHMNAVLMNLWFYNQGILSETDGD
ncbi:transposase zinc-binding domain-containing protein [bacterium AH-315-E10]|nr:transposase zinc-binding domain-containing protein [bacterium AH-315-E10]